MEYRSIPHGNLQISTLGLGMGNIQNSAPEEIDKYFKGL